MSRLILLPLLLINLTGCSSTHLRPQAQASGDFHITKKFAGPPIAGFGACMNPYLYTYPNMPAEISEEQVKDLEAKVKSLHPHFVRIFFLNSWWENDTDPSIAKNHPGMRDSLIRTIRLAQDSGANVLLQFWYDPTRYEDPDDVMRRFTTAIKELRDTHGLTSIKYATIQNEPDENADDVTMRRYVTVYRAFDRALRNANLRDKIKIIGGDLVGEKQSKWFYMLGNELSPILDGYSIHSYWDYWDIRKFRRHLADTRLILDTMPRNQQRPLYITEFGARGFRDKPSIEPGKSVDGQPLADVPTYSFEIAIYMLECINHGFVATAQWDLYEVWYDRKMGYGVIGSVEKGFPLKPGYHLLQMFTHHTHPGWRALKIDGEIEDVWIAALQGSARDRLSVFLLNRVHAEKQITITGLPPNHRFNVWHWNFTGKGELIQSGPITTDARGAVTRKVPDMGLELLTTTE